MSAFSIAMGLISCSKVADEGNAIETPPAHEAVITVGEENLSERSDNNETVVPNTSENSDREVDGKKPFEISRKNFPGKPGNPGNGPGAFGNMKYFTEIRDIEGTLLATLEDASSLILVEDGIVYNWIEKSDEKSICSYYYYDFASSGNRR